MTSDALVTGASTGIGRGAVKVLTANGWRVFAGVRKQADAEFAAPGIRRQGRRRCCSMSPTPPPCAPPPRGARHSSAAKLKGLVNNAGLGLGGPLAHQPLDEIRRVFEVNVLGAVTVSQAFIPLLGADSALTGGPGRIVNITSVAGKFAPPFLGDYAMSKHALEAFSEALRRELMIYGIEVIAIGPGAVATPIWDKAEKSDLSPMPGPTMRRVEEILASSSSTGARGLRPSGSARRSFTH